MESTDIVSNSLELEKPSIDYQAENNYYALSEELMRCVKNRQKVVVGCIVNGNLVKLKGVLATYRPEGNIVINGSSYPLYGKVEDQDDDLSQDQWVVAWIRPYFKKEVLYLNPILINKLVTTRLQKPREKSLIKKAPWWLL